MVCPDHTSHTQSRATSMELEPWEALDVDGSDLSSFLRPCKRHHSHSHSNSPPKSPQPQPQPQPQSETLIHADSAPPPLIPGPAGAVQAAMMHRRARTSHDDPLPTQEFIRRVVQNGHESDHDFNANAWLSAFHFLRSRGMVDADSSVTSGTPLASINKHLNVSRVPQVVAVVKSCTPNGFGDMMVTLKDPTGTISGSVHHKVFTDGEFGKDITVGSVLVLQKVAVFSPTRSTYYLNITLRNVVKVFSKHCGPPSEQIHPALSARRTAPDIETHENSRMLGNTFTLPQERTERITTNHRLDSRFFATERHEKSRMLGNTSSLPEERTVGIMTNDRLDSRGFAKERNEKSWMPGNTFSLPQERTEGIMTNLRLDSRFREVADIDKQKGENLVVTSYHPDNGDDRNQKTVMDRENLSLRQDNAQPAEATCGGELQSEINDQPSPPKLGEGDNLACSAQRTTSSTNSVHISAGLETEVKSHLERQRGTSNPISSIPHWTDEQLDELLAFD